MFRDRHGYYAIAVSSDSLKSVKNALDLLRHNAVSKPERIATRGHDGFDATHLFFYSPERFSRSQELDEVREVWNGTEQFRYNMYIIVLGGKNSLLILLAVPFFAMGRAVFSEFAKSASGLGLVFHSVDLSLLTAAIREGRHDGGLVRLTEVEMVVLGDPSIDRIVLSGTDVLNSATFQELSDSASAAATTLSPSRCRVMFDDHSRPHFGLVTDRYGNFSFRLSRNALNMSSGSELFTFLQREELMQKTFAFPPARGIAKEPEEV